MKPRSLHNILSDSEARGKSRLHGVVLRRKGLLGTSTGADVWMWAMTATFVSFNP
jgi:hypothetical protein